MVVEWLYRRRDVLIQTSQLFWWCVCLSRVSDLLEQKYGNVSIISLSEAKDGQQRADLRHVVAMALDYGGQVNVLHSLHFHPLQPRNRKRSRLPLTPSGFPHINTVQVAQHSIIRGESVH